MAFSTDQEILDRLADLLQKEPAQLDGFWTRAATDSNAAGYGEIVSALAGRGYSAAQIAAWDRAREFNIDQALFWTLTKGATTRDIPEGAQKRIKELDRRLELLTVPVTVGGELVEPGEDDPDDEGAIGYGPLTNSSDVFDMNWKP